MEKHAAVMILAFVFTLSFAISLSHSIVGPCIDQSPHCSAWVSAGFCSTNQGVREEWCRQSCRSCGPGAILQCPQQPCTPLECEDNRAECQYWAANRQCVENPSYMNRNCRKSCGLCSDTPEEHWRDLLALSRIEEWGKWLSGSLIGISSLGSLIVSSSTAITNSITFRRPDGRPPQQLAEQLQEHFSLLSYSSQVQRTLLDSTAEKIRCRAQKLSYNIDEAERLVRTRSVEQIRRHLPQVLQAMSEAGSEAQLLARRFPNTQHNGLLSSDHSRSLNNHWINWIEFHKHLDTIVTQSVMPALKNLEQKMFVVLRYSRVSKNLFDSVAKAAQTIVLLSHMTNVYVDFNDQYVVQALADLDGQITIRLPYYSGVVQTANSDRPVVDIEGFVNIAKQKMVSVLQKEAARRAENSILTVSLTTAKDLPNQEFLARGFPGLPSVHFRPPVTSVSQDNEKDSQQMTDPQSIAPPPSIHKDDEANQLVLPPHPSMMEDDDLYDDLEVVGGNELDVGPPAIDQGHLIFE